MKFMILRGLPGSGKSRQARRLTTNGRTAWCSADHYFHLPRSGGGDRSRGMFGFQAELPLPGEYDFSPAELVHAHGLCLRTAIEAVRRGMDVCVDNTHTSAVELATYVSLAQAYGYDVDIVHVDTPVDVCLRQQTHGVAEEHITAMAARFERDLPPLWPRQRVHKYVPDAA